LAIGYSRQKQRREGTFQLSEMEPGDESLRRTLVLKANTQLAQFESVSAFGNLHLQRRLAMFAKERPDHRRPLFVSMGDASGEGAGPYLFRVGPARTVSTPDLRSSEAKQATAPKADADALEAVTGAIEACTIVGDSADNFKPMASIIASIVDALPL
jgi:hypothetical protein